MKRFDKLILFSATFALIKDGVVSAKATTYVAATSAEVAVATVKEYQVPPGYHGLVFEALHSHGEVMVEWQETARMAEFRLPDVSEAPKPANSYASLFGRG